MFYQKRSFQTITSDILVEIFTHCLSQDDLQCPSADQVPLKLGRICSHWRRVALSYSSLWASLRIGPKTNYGSPFLTYGQCDLMALQEFMARSRVTPVSLAICIKSNLYIEGETPSLIREVISHRQRWKSLELDVEEEAGWELSDLFGAIAEGAPLLESLKVLRGTRNRLLDVLQLDLRRAPQLTSLTLSFGNYALLLPEPETAVGHDKLSQLTITHKRSINDLLQWLPQLPSLRSLDLNLDHYRDNATQRGSVESNTQRLSILQHSQLKDLRFFNHRGHLDVDVPTKTLNAVLRLLDVLQLPALEILSFDILISEGPDMTLLGQKLHNFIFRSSPPLKELIIEDNCIDTHALIGIIELLPVLEKIVVNVHADCDAFVKAFTLSSSPLSESSSQSLLCPRLRSLAIYGDRIVGSKTIIDMILSRCISEERQIGSIDDLKTSLSSCPIAPLVQRLEEFSTFFGHGELKGILRYPLIKSLLGQGLRISEPPQVLPNEIRTFGENHW